MTHHPKISPPSVSTAKAPAVSKSPAVAQRQLADHRPAMQQQRDLHALVHGSPRVTQLAAFSAWVNQSRAQQAAPLQMMPFARDGVAQFMFKAGGMSFTQPDDYAFTTKSAKKAVTPLAHGSYKKLTGHASGYGVEVGDVGSYGAIQHLEQTGDGLTGDHQPSGAAIKEAIRLKLHSALNQPLTRGMAKIAYQKAITLVVTDAWHKAESRTYGGRNTKKQIAADAADLMNASMEDWKKTVPGLKHEGLSDQDIRDIWDSLCAARDAFFSTGDPQYEEFL